jgi:hypothetical protein
MEGITPDGYMYVMLTSAVISVAKIHVICSVLAVPSNLAAASKDE